MFEEESLYIRACLAKICEKEKVNSVLDVGSSDLIFRSKKQPFIEKNIFFPLKRFGCCIYHLDAKSGEGIDIVMDAIELRHLNITFDLVLCFNLLEHVSNIPIVITGLGKVTRNGGYLLITVPKRYPYHADPIDNFFRPDCKTLENIFKDNFIPILSKRIIINDLQIKPRLMSIIKWMKNRRILRFNLLQSTGKFEVSLILLKKRYK